MATTNEHPQEHGDGTATHFVVEVKTDKGTRYAICERLMLVEGGAESLPPAVIEEYLNRHPLRAAAIPTAGDHADSSGARWINLVQAFQSGRAPSLSVTINNNPPPPPPPPPPPKS